MDVNGVQEYVSHLGALALKPNSKTPGAGEEYVSTYIQPSQIIDLFIFSGYLVTLMCFVYGWQINS